MSICLLHDELNDKLCQSDKLNDELYPSGNVNVDIPCMPWRKFSEILLLKFAPRTYWNSLGKGLLGYLKKNNLTVV